MTTTVTSSPPTVTTTGGREQDDEHDNEQEEETYNHLGGAGLNGSCRAYAPSLPRPGAGHLAQLRQVRDDAQRLRDGLP